MGTTAAASGYDDYEGSGDDRCGHARICYRRTCWYRLGIIVWIQARRCVLGGTSQEREREERSIGRERGS